MAGDRRRLFRRARTAAGLPARVVACEDRCSALETNVGVKIAEMRAELAEIRILLQGEMRAQADASELVGRLLQVLGGRLEAVEDMVEDLRRPELVKELRD